MTTLQMKRRRENQEKATILERSAPREAKRLEAKRAELQKDSIDKETLEYLYIRYTVNANVPFSQAEHPDFRLFYSTSIRQQTTFFPTPKIQFALE